MAETRNIPIPPRPSPPPPLRPVPRKVITSLLELLGHDPHKVTAINIHPGYIIVEYTHPIINDPPQEAFEHMIVNDPGGES